MPGIRGERNLRPAAPVRLKGPFGTIIGSPMANVLASKKAQEEAESADSFGGLGGLLGTILGFAAGGPAGAGIGSAIGGAAGGLASSPGRSGQLPIQIPGATGMGAALLGQDEPPEAPGWQQAAGIANMALGPLLSSVGSQAAPQPAAGPSYGPQIPSGFYPQPVPAPIPAPTPMNTQALSYQPPVQPVQQSPMVAQNAFPRAPSGMIPGALANFSVSDLLNPDVQTPDITELIQQQILAGMV